MNHDHHHEFYNHEKRCLADGVKPLTWAQFCRIACQIEAEDAAIAKLAIAWH